MPSVDASRLFGCGLDEEVAGQLDYDEKAKAVPVVVGGLTSRSLKDGNLLALRALNSTGAVPPQSPP